EDISISGVTLPALMQAFQKMIAERERQPQDVDPDDFSVQDQMKQILQVLRGKKEGLSFFALFSPTAGMSEIIATFVALLELVRVRKIVVWQPGPLRELLVMRKS
ncbi:MAG: hypothetical protein NUK65_10320, partial [Firmicutes bacterium]|nr:hypothetical protein [Bacillota bacterium]